MIHVIDHVRFFLGVSHVIVLPLGLLYWFVIHPWARWWRKLGPARTYRIVLPILAALGVLLFRARRLLLGTDLGAHWSLIGIFLVLVVVMTCLDIQYWKQINIATLAGVTELLPDESQKGKLLRKGIYSEVRHPRYLSAAVGVIASALFINYLGLYLLLLVIFPIGFVMLAWRSANWLNVSERDTGNISGRSRNSFPVSEGNVERFPRLRRSKPYH